MHAVSLRVYFFDEVAAHHETVGSHCYCQWVGHQLSDVAQDVPRALGAAPLEAEDQRTDAVQGLSTHCLIRDLWDLIVMSAEKTGSMASNR